MAKYGFSGVNSRFNKSNNFALNTALKTSGINVIAGRVVNVILESSDPTKIGTIEYVDYLSVPKDVSQTNEDQVLKTAKPLFGNISNYPLINELVTILILPDVGIQSSTSSKSGFYINSINIWNHPHHNAIPFVEGSSSPSMVKNYEQVFLGNPKRLTDSSTSITLGKTFVERSNIHPLQSFEGDVIYQGRWGNSIRLGSTVPNTPNNWSSAGNNGDPILIIRNGQGTQSNNGSELITENINNDDSSIYFTTTQQIPIIASSINYFSYPTGSAPIDPNLYTEKQVIVNSGRLLFNSTNDHILLSSAKSISLSAASTVNVDASEFTIQSNKVLLGSKNAKQSVLLGDRTVDTLNILINNLKGFLQVCTTVVVPSDPGALTPLNQAAGDLLFELNKVQGNLEKLKSEYVKTI